MEKRILDRPTCRVGWQGPAHSHAEIAGAILGAGYSWSYLEICIILPGQKLVTTNEGRGGIFIAQLLRKI